MITDAVVNAVMGTLTALFGLFPDWSSAASYSFDPTAFGWVRMVNGIFPLGTLVMGLGLLLGLEVALKTWDLILFVYHQFWGSD